MPLMAHKQHGFKSADSGEVSDLLKAGWVHCDDVMKFKREVMGIGENPGSVVEPVASVEESATIEVQPAPRRPGRPRKEESVPSILNDGTL